MTIVPVVLIPNALLATQTVWIAARQSRAQHVCVIVFEGMRRLRPLRSESLQGIPSIGELTNVENMVGGEAGCYYFGVTNGQTEYHDRVLLDSLLQYR